MSWTEIVKAGHRECQSGDGSPIARSSLTLCRKKLTSLLRRGLLVFCLLGLTSAGGSPQKHKEFISERIGQTVQSHPPEWGGLGKGTENLNWPLPGNFYWQKEPATSGKTVNFKCWRIPSLSIRFGFVFLNYCLVTATHASQRALPS